MNTPLAQRDTSEADRAPASVGSSWRNHVETSFIVYYLTSVIVLLGVYFANAFSVPRIPHPGSSQSHWYDGFCALDGWWYTRIARDGYFYSEHARSSVNYYPGYPLLGRCVMKLTGWPAEVALLVVSQICLVVALTIFAAYLRRRPVGEQNGRQPTLPLLIWCLFPTSLYLRMAYSESLFVLLLVIVMFGLQRKWPPIAVAVVVGLATAVRPVGFVLAVPLLVSLWEHSAIKARWLMHAVALLPLCFWGLAAYMAYQAWAFGDPTAFMKASGAFVSRPWIATVRGNLVALLTLEPIRSVYDSDSIGYWGMYPPQGEPLFNLQFANPLYFVLAVTLIVIGVRKRWLSRQEWTLSAALLVVPYALNGYRSCMAGQARYAVVVLPAFIVLGELLSRLPTTIKIGLGGLSAVFLFIYSVLFSSWYWFT